MSYNQIYIQNKKGFTLIELLVVVAIIGILAAVGVVAYSGYTSAAKEKALRSIHKNLVNMIINNKALCEVQGGGDITLYKDTSRHIKHWCNMDVGNAQNQYVEFLIYGGWKNPYDSSQRANSGYPGKTGVSVKCCINSKQYIEVHSFTTKTQYFVTNIEWE